MPDLNTLMLMVIAAWLIRLALIFTGGAIIIIIDMLTNPYQ